VSDTNSNSAPLTVVLVHGAFADASSSVVATADKAAGWDVIHSMAERAGTTVTEVEASHVVMVSQPGTVADVILTAAAAVEEAAATVGG
jgi:hypothetical protein